MAAAWLIAVTAMAWSVWAAGAPPAAEPPTDRPLKLDESIQLAFQNHGDVGVALAQLFGAQQRVTIARAPLFPQADATWNLQRFNQVRTQQVGANLTRTGTTHQLSHQYSLGVSQLIWDMGQTRTQVRLAKAGVQGAQAGVGQARTTVAFDVANTYFEQLRAERLLALRKQQVEQAQKQVEMVQAQIDAGVSAKIDILQVRTRLSQAKFNLLVAENQARISATNFRNALGLDRGPALRLEDVSEEMPSSSGSLDDYVAEALRLRPDLQQIKATLLQSEASYTLSKIRARPIVNVNYDYTEGLGDSPLNKQWFLVGTLTVPLFNSGSLWADVRDARADVQANKIRLQQLAKDVSAAVEAAHTNLVNAVERISASRALVDEARENLLAAQEKYRLGVGIALEIVDAQVQFDDAQVSATEAFYDYYVAKAALDRAIGVWASGQEKKQVKINRRNESRSNPLN
jgi:outer membrane protein TolC